MINVLLQTTIEASPDDWDISRFSLLKQLLEEAVDDKGEPVFAVTARNRTAVGSPDPVLSTLADSSFDEVWLFAVDTGDGLTPEDCQGISAFRKKSGGLLVTRDHMDLGSSICDLAGVGAAHYFHSKNVNPDSSRHRIDDEITSYILWPNYHSGSNGNFQRVQVVGEPHDVLFDESTDGKTIAYLPAHPHEGEVGVPPDDSTARVILQGRSLVTDNPFNIAVAFEPSASGGPAIAQSTFHHFADYNWDPRLGCPSFVSEKPGNDMLAFPAASDATRRYVVNVALWLAGVSPSTGNWTIPT